MAYGDVYEIKHAATIATAITMLQAKAGAAVPFEVLSWWLNQAGTVVSLQENVKLVRKSAAATVTTAVIGTHVLKTRGAGQPDPALSLGTAATGVIATAEGTDTDVIHDVGFNVLAGTRWDRTIDGEVIVPAGTIIGLKFGATPTTQSWKFGMMIRELGS